MAMIAIVSADATKVERYVTRHQKKQQPARRVRLQPDCPAQWQYDRLAGSAGQWRWPARSEHPHSATNAAPAEKPTGESAMITRSEIRGHDPTVPGEPPLGPPSRPSSGTTQPVSSRASPSRAEACQALPNPPAPCLHDRRRAGPCRTVLCRAQVHGAGSLTAWKLSDRAAISTFAGVPDRSVMGAMDMKARSGHEEMTTASLSPLHGRRNGRLAWQTDPRRSLHLCQCPPRPPRPPRSPLPRPRAPTRPCRC